MKRNLLQRIIIISIITLVALYIVIGPRDRPQLSDFTFAGIKQTLSENIRLGLDLKGGSHLVMEVQVAEYLERLTRDTAFAVQTAAKEAGFAIGESRPDTSGGSYRIVLDTGDASKSAEVRDAVQKKVNLSGWSESVAGNTVTWTLTPTAERALSQQAVDQAYRIIESRINAVGVAEPTLQVHGGAGSHQILLQMPGIQDPERVKKLLAGESRLELVHIVSPPNPQPVQTYATKEEAEATFPGGQAPSNRKVLPYADRDDPTMGEESGDQKSEQPKRWVIVEYPPVVDGSQLRNADPVSRSGRDNDYQVSFSLKQAGAERFGPWTAGNINQYMGVVLNNEVKSAAFIKSQIIDSGEISGRFTKGTANDLALTLRSGALPARIVYQEERTVGPSLGADSIRAGVTASIAGLIFVILFMVVYYRGAGINAVVALLLNMILTIAALVLFDATLTLPGIAGLILTIGMAVDSNVLIFERIREELETGKTVASAIEQGFSRAFVTIIDTHVTTIVSALFLFVFGTGPIRGFAVTLVLGLLANLFSAVYVSRTIFMWVLSRREGRVESLSI